MKKINAKWSYDPETGTYRTELKENSSIFGEGRNRSSATRAFLKACKNKGLPGNRKSYRIFGTKK